MTTRTVLSPRAGFIESEPAYDVVAGDNSFESLKRRKVMMLVAFHEIDP